MFVAGGAVQAGGGVYLERDADRELLQRCRAGDFTYILTSRQMGKTSLMYRAAERLADEGIRPVIVDLTELGAQTTAEQWYRGFLLLVQEQLGLRSSASEWWHAHADLAYAQRLTRYLREVALVERSERLVVFVDEIDTTLRLDFTDDFFAAIRFLYQSRAADPALHRISFVLIGVATPNDLIKDTARTPFNIGHRIDLDDFSPRDAAALAAHLALPPEAGGGVMTSILRWTGGHPYLTMRVLRSLAESPPAAWTPAAVDARVHDLFFGPGGESDTNLQFVRDMLTKKAFNREAVLREYERVRGGARVPDRDLDQIASWLKLSGVVRRQDGTLRVRNAIYQRVFDERWAREHRRLNINWRRRLARAAAALLVLTVALTIPLAMYAWWQKDAAESERRQAEIQRDAAERERERAEAQLLITQENLAVARDAVEKLREFNPKAAEALSVELAGARKVADAELKKLNDEREALRGERDQARQALATTTRENEALRQKLAQLSAPVKTSQPAEPPVTVPSVLKMQAADAQSVLERAGLRPRLAELTAAPDRGTVIRQLPEPGTSVGRGTIVSFSVSTGPPPVIAAAGTSDDALQLLRSLERYRAGYETLDPNAIRAVYPSADVEGLRKAFEEFRTARYALSVAVGGISISEDRQTATVTAFENYEPVGRIVSPPPRSGVVIFNMRRVGNAWTIQSVTATAQSAPAAPSSLKAR